jgi:benzoyl-CoA reductase subunit C
MAETQAKGLTRAKEIFGNRDRRARELKASGKTVIGYVCIYPVLEMMTALDMVPYRMFGDMSQPIVDADRYLPLMVCPFLRSLLDVGLKGQDSFLDGVVMAHVCDVGARVSHLWDVGIKTPYSYFIDVPHTDRDVSQNRFKELLQEFQRSLESFAGKSLTVGRLKEAVEEHNKQRALVRDLYDLRKLNPPQISGAEVLQVMAAVMSLPVEEGSGLLREVISDVSDRKNGPTAKSCRLLLWGSILDNPAFIEMIETLDANVAMDDTCVGSRAFFSDVQLTDDPLDGLAHRYLKGINCPRTFRESNINGTARGYAADLEARFGYLGKFAREWRVDGVVLQVLKYCDSHGYEVPQLKDYLTGIGLPSVYVEHDYSGAALAQARTRVQGLIEMIS